MFLARDWSWNLPSHRSFTPVPLEAFLTSGFFSVPSRFIIRGLQEASYANDAESTRFCGSLDHFV
jgi:hypothetical protein